MKQDFKKMGIFCPIKIVYRYKKLRAGDGINIQLHSSSGFFYGPTTKRVGAKERQIKQYYFIHYNQILICYLLTLASEM
jgi:hypothetical protein